MTWQVSAATRTMIGIGTLRKIGHVARRNPTRPVCPWKTASGMHQGFLRLQQAVANSMRSVTTSTIRTQTRNAEEWILGKIVSNIVFGLKNLPLAMATATGEGFLVKKVSSPKFEQTFSFFEQEMGVSKNSGTPKWMVKIMENPKMDDLGVFLYFRTWNWGNTQIDMHMSRLIKFANAGKLPAGPSALDPAIGVRGERHRPEAIATCCISSMVQRCHGFLFIKNLETLILKGFSKGHRIFKTLLVWRKTPSISQAVFPKHQLRRTIGTVVWRSTITTHLLKRFSSGLRTRELAERSKNGRLVWENATGSIMKLGQMVAAHMKRN